MEQNQFFPMTLFGADKGKAHVVGLPGKFDIRKELARADSIHLATAYGHMSGWSLIKDAVLACGGIVYLLAGVNDCLTEPSLLVDWLHAAREDAVFARVFDIPKPYFHPKVLLLNAESNDAQKMRFAIVGSGNLSRRGLLDNIECSAYIDRAESVLELKSWFESLFTISSPVTANFITEYEPRYRTARRRKEKNRGASRRLAKRMLQARPAVIERKVREVIGETTKFHVVNTNIRYDPDGGAHMHMLKNHEACAYEKKWMKKIKNIKKGDIVFLYRSKKWPTEVSGKPGIVAFGIATDRVRDRPSEDTCCVKLEGFRRFPPISAEDITAMNGSRITFGQVWQRPNRELADKLLREALNRCSW